MDRCVRCNVSRTLYGAAMRMLSIEPFWPWLPAFRVVAETEHVGRAAKLLHISASALSRTLRQLEGAVGEPLFDRVGTGLRLNAAGAVLLEATRDAIRVVEDGAARARRAPVVVQLGAVDDALFPVAAACAAAGDRPGMPARVELSHVDADASGKAVARGALDLAVVDEGTRAPAWLERTALPPVPRGVWAQARAPAASAMAVLSSRTVATLAAGRALLPDALAMSIGWRHVEGAPPLLLQVLRRPRAGTSSGLDRALDVLVDALQNGDASESARRQPPGKNDVAMPPGRRQ
jgi:DNA-binding transcriptional LysR family regulator